MRRRASRPSGSGRAAAKWPRAQLWRRTEPAEAPVDKARPLATVGVFGVVSHQTTQRTREVGIRIALGAQAAQIRRMIVLDALLPAAGGVAIGAALLWWTQTLRARCTRWSRTTPRHLPRPRCSCWRSPSRPACSRRQESPGSAGVLAGWGAAASHSAHWMATPTSISRSGRRRGILRTGLIRRMTGGTAPGLRERPTGRHGPGVSRSVLGSSSPLSQWTVGRR